MPQPKKPQRYPLLAINLFDLGGFAPMLQAKVAAMVDAQAVVRPVEEPSEACVAFKADTLLAAGAIDVLRSEDRRAGDKPCRAWVRRGEGSGWERIPPDVVLTSLVGGKVTLGPWLGGSAAVPLKVGKVILGRNANAQS